MLTNIENRLEELFEQIEMMPSDKVEAAEKVRRSSLVVFSGLWMFLEAFGGLRANILLKLKRQMVSMNLQTNSA